mmetsp:Transcript_20263/g.25578  ORF Transcript_20263/g.25578 Transcript_20263/m.25578 type:complete len:330 (-) Transcript_20263:418-1407(-)
MKQNMQKNLVVLCALLLIAKVAAFLAGNLKYFPSHSPALFGGSQSQTIVAGKSSILQRKNPLYTSKKRPRTIKFASDQEDSTAEAEASGQVGTASDDGDSEILAEDAAEQEQQQEEEEAEPPKEPTEAELLQAEIKELEKQLNGLEIKAKKTQENILESGKTGYMRAAAEVDNYKRRRSEDLKQLTKQGMAIALNSMTSILDEFEEVYANFDEATTEEGVAKIYKSYNGLYGQLNIAFEKLGLAKFHAAEGEEFSVAKHEKVSEEHNEEVKAGVILSEVAAGYDFNGVLVRPAKCIVSAGPVPVQEEEGDSPEEVPQEQQEATEDAESS